MAARLSTENEKAAFSVTARGTRLSDVRLSVFFPVTRWLRSRKAFIRHRRALSRRASTRQMSSGVLASRKQGRGQPWIVGTGCFPHRIGVGVGNAMTLSITGTCILSFPLAYAHE